MSLMGEPMRSDDVLMKDFEQQRFFAKAGKTYVVCQSIATA